MLSVNFTFLALAAQSLALATQVEDRSLDQIYEAAKRENGTLTVYSGGSSTFTSILITVTADTNGGLIQLVVVQFPYWRLSQSNFLTSVSMLPWNSPSMPILASTGAT